MSASQSGPTSDCGYVYPLHDREHLVPRCWRSTLLSTQNGSDALQQSEVYGYAVPSSEIQCLILQYVSLIVEDSHAEQEGGDCLLQWSNSKVVVGSNNLLKGRMDDHGGSRVILVWCCRSWHVEMSPAVISSQDVVEISLRPCLSCRYTI